MQNQRRAFLKIFLSLSASLLVVSIIPIAAAPVMKGLTFSESVIVMLVLIITAFEVGILVWIKK